MDKLKILIFIIAPIFLKVYGQSNSLYKEKYTCGEIQQGKFLDTLLYKQIPNQNGKLAPLFLAKYKIYEVWVDGKLKDYVTEPLKSYLESSIKNNGCDNILIQPLRAKEEVLLKKARDTIIPKKEN